MSDRPIVHNSDDHLGKYGSGIVDQAFGFLEVKLIQERMVDPARLGDRAEKAEKILAADRRPVITQVKDLQGFRVLQNCLNVRPS